MLPLNQDWDNEQDMHDEEGSWCGQKAQTSDSCIFVGFPAGLLHGLTSRTGLSQGDTDVLCQLAWLSALLSFQGGE